MPSINILCQALTNYRNFNDDFPSKTAAALVLASKPYFANCLLPYLFTHATKQSVDVFIPEDFINFILKAAETFPKSLFQSMSFATGFSGEFKLRLLPGVCDLFLKNSFRQIETFRIAEPVDFEDEEPYDELSSKKRTTSVARNGLFRKMPEMTKTLRTIEVHGIVFGQGLWRAFLESLSPITKEQPNNVLQILRVIKCTLHFNDSVSCDTELLPPSLKEFTLDTTTLAQTVKKLTSAFIKNLPRKLKKLRLSHLRTVLLMDEVVLSDELKARCPKVDVSGGEAVDVQKFAQFFEDAVEEANSYFPPSLEVLELDTPMRWHYSPVFPKRAITTEKEQTREQKISNNSNDDDDNEDNTSDTNTKTIISPKDEIINGLFTNLSSLHVFWFLPQALKELTLSSSYLLQSAADPTLFTNINNPNTRNNNTLQIATLLKDEPCVQSFLSNYYYFPGGLRRLDLSDCNLTSFSFERLWVGLWVSFEKTTEKDENTNIRKPPSFPPPATFLEELIISSSGIDGDLSSSEVFHEFGWPPNLKVLDFGKSPMTGHFSCTRLLQDRTTGEGCRLRVLDFERCGVSGFWNWYINATPVLEIFKASNTSFIVPVYPFDFEMMPSTLIELDVSKTIRPCDQDEVKETLKRVLFEEDMISTRRRQKQHQNENETEEFYSELSSAWLNAIEEYKKCYWESTNNPSETLYDFEGAPPNLKVLKMSSLGIDGLLDFRKLNDNLPALEVLMMNDNNLRSTHTFSGSEPQSLNLTNLPRRLRILDLSNNNFGENVDFRSVPSFMATGLKELKLGQNGKNFVKMLGVPKYCK